jgi:hypothetical protein
VSESLKRGRKAKLRPVDRFELRLQREAGVSLAECCTYWGISKATALKYLAELRTKLGREKLPNEQRARSYLGRLDNHQA